MSEPELEGLLKAAAQVRDAERALRTLKQQIADHEYFLPKLEEDYRSAVAEYQHRLKEFAPVEPWPL